MEEKSWLELMSKEAQVEQVLHTVSYSEQFGLVLSREEAELLAEERTLVLRKERRAEFGEGILSKLICAFCDSDFISQDNYCSTLLELQEIFYLFKNELQDELTDDELLTFMREQFDGVCFGDSDYLKGTCLEVFARAVRAGYRGYEQSGGQGEFGKFDEVTRWDRQLYLEALQALE